MLALIAVHLDNLFVELFIGFYRIHTIGCICNKFECLSEGIASGDIQLLIQGDIDTACDVTLRVCLPGANINDDVLSTSDEGLCLLWLNRSELILYKKIVLSWPLGRAAVIGTCSNCDATCSVDKIRLMEPMRR